MTTTHERKPLAAALADLCAWCADQRPENIPAEVRERAALVVADTVGVALAGATESEMTALRSGGTGDGSGVAPCSGGDGSPQFGPATLLAPGLPVASPDDAAFQNATSIGFLELDQGSRPTGHPALHVVPAVLADAEARGRNRGEFLAAMLAGHEVQARLQRAIRFRPDIHPHGHMGVVAAAVALAKLRGWDGDAAFRAACAAASLTLATTWQPCLAGASVRNAWAAVAGQSAATALRLVEAGFTVDEDALEDTFTNVLGEAIEPEPLAEALGTHWHILTDYFKFHAACALTHPALDAVADALKAIHRPGAYPILPLTGAGTTPRADSAPRDGALAGGRLALDLEDIASIVVGVPERNLRLAGLPVPHDLSLKFSIPFTVAAYLATGETGPGTFRTERWQNPAVQALAARVKVQADASLTGEWPRHHGAWVRIRMKDGRELAGRSEDPFGSPGHEATPADLKAKFMSIAAEALPPTALERLWQGLLSLGDPAGDTRAVGDIFATARRMLPATHSTEGAQAE